MNEKVNNITSSTSPSRQSYLHNLIPYIPKFLQPLRKKLPPIHKPSNHPPVARDDRLGTASNKPVVGAILNNDLDPDGDKLKIISASSPTKIGGTVTINNNGTITFLPANDFAGIDTFSYTISDGKGKSDKGKVSVTITSTSDNINKNEQDDKTKQSTTSSHQADKQGNNDTTGQGVQGSAKTNNNGNSNNEEDHRASYDSIDNSGS